MADTYTKFPEGIDTFEDNADLDSGHAAAAAQYTKYLADGKYTEASNYLNRYKGLDFLTEHYEAEHLLSLDDCVQDLARVCYNNGGGLL